MDCEVEQFVSLLQLRIWGRKIVKLRSTQINPEVVAARDIPSGVDDMTQVGTAIHLVRNAVGRNDGKRDTAPEAGSLYSSKIHVKPFDGPSGHKMCRGVRNGDEETWNEISRLMKVPRSSVCWSFTW